MNDKKTRVQKIVASSREATNILLKELVRLREKLMEDREEAVELMKKEGVFDDILSYLKEEADKGDQVSLNVFNLWKYGRLPE